MFWLGLIRSAERTILTPIFPRQRAPDCAWSEGPGTWWTSSRKVSAWLCAPGPGAGSGPGRRTAPRRRVSSEASALCRIPPTWQRPAPPSAFRGCCPSGTPHPPRLPPAHRRAARPGDPGKPLLQREPAWSTPGACPSMRPGLQKRCRWSSRRCRPVPPLPPR